MKTKLTTFWNWMVEASVNVGKALGGIFLTILALLLIAVLILPALIWLVVVSVKNEEKRQARNFLENIKEFFVGIAFSFDQTGNIAFGGFFNWLFLTSDAQYFFGDPAETISFVLGWNQKAGHLSKTGKVLAFILDKLDKDHCRLALEIGIAKAEIKIFEYNKLITQ